MNQDDIQLIFGYLDGTLRPNEVERLNRLLLECEEARAFLRAQAANDVRLREIAANRVAEAEAGSLESSRPARAGWFARSLLGDFRFPIAAGLVAGVLGTSALWAFSHPSAPDRLKTVARVVVDGFEDGVAPEDRGVPTRLDSWGGDHAVVCEAEQGISPRSGNKMMRLLRSNFSGEDSEFSHVGDQMRIIDVAAFHAVIATGRAVVAAEAHFNLIKSRPGEAFAGGLQVYAFSHDPRVYQGTGWKAWYEGHLSLSGQQQERADDDPSTWERVTTDLPLPLGTQFLVVHVRINRIRPEPTATPVVFSGAYVDDVKVQLLVRSAASRDSLSAEE
jgi:hypothetical protein